MTKIIPCATLAVFPYCALFLHADFMKIQIWSDLHVEHLQPGMGAAAALTIDPSADLLVLAGDIASGDASFTMARNVAQKAGKLVAWLPGNHEFYGRDMAKQLARYHEMAANQSDVIALLDGEHVLNGVRLVGGTLWTDFKLYEGVAARLPTVEKAMAVGDQVINDFKLIKWSGERFTAKRSEEIHRRTRAYLEKVLGQPFAGPTVVITHHAPHPKSIHATYAAGERALKSEHRLPNDDGWWMANPCFVSDLAPLVQQARVWIHGHVHNSFDYLVDGHRVIANPRGYPRGFDEQGRLVFENPEFNPLKVIEV